MDAQNNEKNTGHRRPDFSGDGLAIWRNVDKNGNEFLSVKVLGGKPINCFRPIVKGEAADAAAPSTPSNDHFRDVPLSYNPEPAAVMVTDEYGRDHLVNVEYLEKI